jgi:hypothetical protein
VEKINCETDKDALRLSRTTRNLPTKPLGARQKPVEGKQHLDGICKEFSFLLLMNDLMRQKHKAANGNQNTT